MADALVYRLLAGAGLQIDEDSASKTATLSVPGLASKINTGDISQATTLVLGLVRLASSAEARLGTDPDKAITPATLAAAAQSALNDASAGRLLRVGAFGVGGSNLVLNGADLNADLPTGFYWCTSCTNGPTALAGHLIQEFQTSNFVAQTYKLFQTATVYFRTKNNGTWSGWAQAYTSQNFDPATKANTSGTYNGITSGNSAAVNGQTDSMLSPPGMIGHFARASVPSGWLEANGAAVGRTTYPALFAAIGVLYGAGNGSTTFNLPDLRGYFVRSWDDGRGVDTGRVFGTTQNSQNVSHSHTGSTSTALDHVHNAPHGDGGVGTLKITNFASGQGPVYDIPTSPAGAHSHTLSLSPDGGGEARPINIALLACIKT